MAKAMKCDRRRCGKYFDYDIEKGTKSYVSATSGNCTDIYDLCPDCMNWLQRWLKCKGKLKEAE